MNRGTGGRIRKRREEFTKGVEELVGWNETSSLGGGGSCLRWVWGRSSPWGVKRRQASGKEAGGGVLKRKIS